MSRWETALADAEAAVTGSPALSLPIRSRERAALDTAMAFIDRIIRHPRAPASLMVDTAREAKARIEEILK